jgi:CBS domain-containing protein
MKVGDICGRNVVTVREFEELAAAAQLMREHHIGYLVVVEPNVTERAAVPVGVVTDRDIVVGVIAKGADPRSLRVGDVMTREPVLAEADSSVSAALHRMREIGVRRLPVVGSMGQLLGVLSLDDVLDAFAEELMDVARSIRHELKMEGTLRP